MRPWPVPSSADSDIRQPPSGPPTTAMRTYQIVRLTCDSPRPPRWPGADGGVAPGSVTLVARPPGHRCCDTPAWGPAVTKRCFLITFSKSGVSGIYLYNAPTWRFRPLPRRPEFFPRTGPARSRGGPIPCPPLAARGPDTLLDSLGRPDRPRRRLTGPSLVRCDRELAPPTRRVTAGADPPHC